MRRALAGIILIALCLACSPEDSAPSGPEAQGGAGAMAGVGATGSGASGGFGATGGVGASAGVGGTGGSGAQPACAPGTTAPCYSGPPGSDGIATCKAGIKTCEPTGFFGPCAGEVLPSPRSCASPADEACNGSADPCLKSPLFAAIYGDETNQYASLVASDPEGSMILSGTTHGTVDFGAGPLGPSGMYLVKLDANGSVVWQKIFPANAIVRSLVTDAAGNVFIYGPFDGTLDLGGGALSSGGNTALFLAKLDGSGQHAFSIMLPVYAKELLDWGAATTPNGDVVITGPLKGSADLGGGPLVSAGNSDLLVAKFDAAGNHLWSARYGGVGNEIGTAVAVDKSGDVIVTGYFSGSFNLGGDTLVASGTDVFVAKLDGSGKHIWSEALGGSGNQAARHAGVDDAGEIAVIGMANPAVDLGGGPKRATAAGTLCFAGKLGPTGAHLWSMAFGCTENPYTPLGPRIAVSPSGSAYATGTFLAPGATPFAFAVDPSGAPKWSLAFSSKWGEGLGIALDPSGNVLVTGSAQGGIDFGTGPLAAAGAEDVFLAKLAP